MAEHAATRLGAGQTVGELVADLTGRLGAFDDPRREAMELLAALLDVPRHWPVLKENKWLECVVWQRAREAAALRARGAPLAYAVGKANFRGFTLAVDERVLIPRPETELLVELVLGWKHDGQGGGRKSGENGRGAHDRREDNGGNAGCGVAVDVGTGSGAIAIALAVEGKFDQVFATDASLDALDVARANAARVAEPKGARIAFAHGDLLGPVLSNAPFDVIVSNPPYIAPEEMRELPRSVRDWEPALALYSAKHGLAATERLVRQAASCLAPGGLLALEVDARRASLVAELVASTIAPPTASTASDAAIVLAFEHVTVHLDLAGRERFVFASRRHHEREDRP